uniref:Conserved oligomeric Golgi complex subunit 8 n=1 Tax=Cafeteria roenbergensis TaxID=33653 RepID=A0A7S0JQC0_CAFRO
MASAAAAESSTDFAGLSLRELASVPSQLRSEEALLEEQVRALALANYKVHIDCVDASRRVSEELTELRSQCSEALSHGAEAEATLEGDLAHRLELLLDEELRVHRALRHERDLTDLAELPAVAEACLRHGRTDQLLDLCDVVNAMVTRHPVGTGGHAVVAAIAVGLRRARDRALNNIESALSAPALPLTAALDLVRPMRRILLQRARERAGAAPAAAAARPSPGNGPDAGLASPMSLLFAAAGSAGGQHAGPATPSADPMALGRGVLGGGRGGASHSASGTMPPPEEDAREEALERFLAARTAALRRVEADAASLPPLRRLTAVLDASRALWADVPRAADALFLRRAEAASSPVDSAPPAAGTPGAGPAPASAPFVAAASVDGARRLVCWMDDSSAAAADLVAEIAPQLRSGADLVNASDAVLFAFARAAPLATDRCAQAQLSLRLAGAQLVAGRLDSAVAAFDTEVRRGAWAYLAALAAAAGSGGGAAHESAADRRSGQGEAGSGAAKGGPPSAVLPVAPAQLMRCPPLARAVNGLLAAADDARRCAHVIGTAALVRASEAFVRGLCSAQARAVRDDAVAELAAADGHSEADEAAAKEQVAELTRQLIEVVPPFVAAVVGHVTRSDLVAWPGAPATAAERADCQAEAATPPGAATHAPAPSRGDRSTDALP